MRSVLDRARHDDWDTLRLLNAHYYQNHAESIALEAGDPSRMPVPLSESRWTILLMEEIQTPLAATTRGTSTRSRRRSAATSERDDAAPALLAGRRASGPPAAGS